MNIYLLFAPFTLLTSDFLYFSVLMLSHDKLA
jgi:hypothetical protein